VYVQGLEICKPAACPILSASTNLPMNGFFATVSKTYFWSRFYIKTIINHHHHHHHQTIFLPRQARDKHRKKLQKEVTSVSQVTAENKCKCLPPQQCDA
jgi:hypothetical protein